MSMYDVLLARNLNGGGGSVEMPIFTLTWDADWEEIVSVTCDKTYAQCLEYIENGMNSAIVYETDEPHTETATYTAFYAEAYSGEDSLTYVAESFLQPAFDIHYNSDGTIEYEQDSAAYVEMDITSEGTYYPQSMTYPSPINVNLSGSMSVVKGTFKGTESGVMNINVPYNGNGYPLFLLIFPSEPYAYGGEFYNLLKRYAIVSFSIIKAVPDNAPTYTGNGQDTNDRTIMYEVYKSSVSAAETTVSGYDMYGILFKNIDASGANAGGVCRIKSKNVFSVNIIGSSNYGFAQDIEYTYYVGYSS